MKLTKQSGAGKQKGDLFNDHMLIESKDTAGASISLKQGWLKKLLKEATDVNKTPVLVITFGDGEEYFCINRQSFDHFNQLIGEDYAK